MLLNGSDKSQAGVHRGKVSPLPVKHFDFSHDENIIKEKKFTLERSETLDALTSGAVDTSCINQNDVSTSSSKRNPETGIVGNAFDKAKRDSRKVHEILKGAFDAIEEVNLLRKERSDQSHAKTNDATATPSSSMPLKNHLQLTSWLPSEICSIYMKKGISSLYPWQVDCLTVDGVLERRNLVYCASTSAGKSFVAEILMLRRVVLTGKIAILVLPYVSICVEKAEHLELVLEPLGKHVRSFYGNQGGGSLPKDTSVAVCTIEKANSLINKLLEEGRLSEVGIIVIDELHMVGDQHRGYLLEIMLTKLRYAAGEGNTESSSERVQTVAIKADPARGLQIIGMSATMPNVAAVADWLQAALYQTDFRPVPLEEYIKVGNTIFDKKLDVVRVLPKTSDFGGKDPDHIVELCNEVVQEGHSVLLFCSSRKGCETTARHVSKFLKKFSVATREVCEFNDTSSAIEALRNCPAGLDPVLEETIPSGVGYHHAGLTVEEREIVETCYRKGLVRVLTATSTLAAGVNLPARRVIFRQPRVGRDFLDGTRYRQMAGSGAGVTGIDTKGESILVCKPDELKKVSAILNDSCPPLQSCLSEDKNGMIHAILEVVAGVIVQTASDIHRYVRCTLLNSTKPFQDVVKSAQDSLRWLCHNKFLEWNEETRLYSTTPLGQAAFGSSLSPEESLVVLEDLLRAREGFVLASDLHLVYLVTPINVDIEPDWELYYERFMELSAIDQSVGNRVGVAEPFLMRMAHGAPVPGQNWVRGKKNGPYSRLQKRDVPNNKILLSSEQTLRVAKRFYVALMLSRLVQEAPVADVCEAFKVARGTIQGLQENAGRFASMVSLFSGRLGWHDLEGLVAKFQNRVSFGVRAEIVELTNIPYVKGSRARALYKAGLRTPLAIAEASVPDIVKALFEYSSWTEENSALRRVQLGAAKKIKKMPRVKVVLDQAEEARLAAFSTFKSLGIHMPQFSRPFPPIKAEGLLMGNNLNNHTDDACQVITGNHLNNHTDDACQAIMGNNLIEHTAKIDAKEVRSTRAMDNDHKNANAQLVREDMLRGVSVPSCHRSNLSDKGPISMSNFQGGFDFFLDKWDAVKEFYFDVHFTKHLELSSCVQFEVFGLAICWKNSPVYYINLTKDLVASGKQNKCLTGSLADDATNGLAINDMWELARCRWNKIAKIMQQNGVRKTTWNLKVQIQVLKIPSISIQRFGRLYHDHKDIDGIEVLCGSYLLLPSISVCDGIDMCLISWILWPDEESKSNQSLEKLVKKRMSSEAAAAANRDSRWKNQMHKAAHNGCCRRVAQTRALDSVFGNCLLLKNLVEALTNIETPLVKVLADMELWGIGIDMEACLHARHILVRKLKELEAEAYSLAGIRFSLSTAADIANVLYRHLKLPLPKGCNIGKTTPYTRIKRSLDLLRNQHPIISVIKEHRTLAKLLNSTLGSICSRARLCMKSHRYTIQGHWLQTSTATGRLSMEEPNLQCVEHVVFFRSYQSDEHEKIPPEINCDHINARDFFIPTQDNWLLLSADYSQIELRLMAHFSQRFFTESMFLVSQMECFYYMIASRWTSKRECMVSSQERDQAEKTGAGILYGLGANTLAEQLECSSEEAAEKIKSFKVSFPGVSSWLQEVVASCRHKGYVETLKGRKTVFSLKIKTGNNKERAKAQRQAVNSLCQGSAADIIKIAMINIHSVISEGIWRARNLINGSFNQLPHLKGNCRIILQVHDELVLEVDPKFIKEAGNLLQMSMENAASLLVPLRVKLKFGKTWGSLQPFVPET
ncbi:LOW QUALITY PROTEIN: helicase and polymerase-containing protein TEBICHI-like [Dioscorea cayenensis subsp. rotundata]|uniref:LOW QUALITY PROTEIN: helicase and polymerase-containing protein TEBICHI-like n=1 Tax=Dioscorea cayennensis subsp. rotundata TaxID=55577 RepID=A0AB40CXH8_DIOCR|nr:LOW QUALITY PROTEIN: helicase and polymerase-containing protein TEBICHI-like [Dioscorea cayenensis subsp. rotundata]